MAILTSKVIFLSDKKTSMRLAAAEWEAIDIICKRENIKRNSLLEMINRSRNKKMGLTCAVRLFSLVYLYQMLNETQCQNYTFPALKAETAILKAINEIL